MGRMDNMDYHYKSRRRLFAALKDVRKLAELPCRALPCLALPRIAFLMLKAFFVVQRFAREIQARFAFPSGEVR